MVMEFRCTSCIRLTRMVDWTGHPVQSKHGAHYIGFCEAQTTAMRNKKLLVTKGIATRSKDATSSSWPYY